MDQRLILAAQEGDINSLYDLLREDPYILETIDAVPFTETPIHVAASHGQTRFAVEVMILKPSLGRKLNLNGFSPVHLSIEKGDIETVRGLIDMDKDLVSVKGKQGMTPLHSAVVEGRIEILKEMLLACPDSIKDLSGWRESALHLAVKNNQFKALRILVQHIYMAYEETIFLWKDDEGHTVLHLMILGSRLKMIKLLCRCYPMDSMSFGINVMDGSGQTAMDILEDPHHHQLHGTQRNSINHLEEMKKILYRYGALRTNSPNNNRVSITRIRYLISTAFFINTNTRINSDAQNALLVVAGLIATVTFQIGVNPPGGFWQDSTIAAAAAGSKQNQAHMAGTSVMAVVRPSHYGVITAFNFMGFLSSVCLIILLTMRLPLRGLITTSLFFTTATYVLSLFAINWSEKAYRGTYMSPLTKKIYRSPALALFVVFGIFVLFCHFSYPMIRKLFIRKMDDDDYHEDDENDGDGDGDGDGNGNEPHRDVISGA